jgi:hypothetical protein
LPEFRRILPVHHVMDSPDAWGLREIRLRECGGGSKATEQD